jgi:DNA replication protein DnaC
LESFEFKFQPSIDPKLIRELATGRYIQSGDNLLFLGPPGVGKSHLAVALGMKACEQGIRTLFVTATALITTLGKALAEGRLEERLKLLTQPQLLICDEIGYLPIDRQGANLFFQLVSRRYERGSIIITSNQSLGAWGEVFGDPLIAGAIPPSAPPLDYDQHQRRKLQTQGVAQDWPAQTQARPSAGRMNGGEGRPWESP